MDLFTLFGIAESRRNDVPDHGQPTARLPVVVMDGGMGTTLEDDFQQDFSGTPLWSARLIRDDPSTLKEAHLAFLRAGCRVFQTATYQCAFETFRREGHSDADATKLMRTAVSIADDARRTWLAEQAAAGQSTAPRPVLCLSLGPYGATIPGAQEFTGLYPPPFGPAAADAPIENRTTSFSTTEQEEVSPRVAELEERAICALADFHLRRLQVFAEDHETWNRIDLITFETVPLLRESRAIVRAMSELQRGMSSQAGCTMKPWVVAFDFPGEQGECVSERWKGGLRITTDVLIQHLLPSPSTAADDTSPPLISALPAIIPVGVGINCTSPRFLPRLINEMTVALQRHPITNSDIAPWLIIYPNGGVDYNPQKGMWHRQDDAAVSQGWARDVLEKVRQGLADSILSHTQWAGVVIGGCCKVAPEDIRVLASLVKEAGYEL